MHRNTHTLLHGIILGWLALAGVAAAAGAPAGGSTSSGALLELPNMPALNMPPATAPAVVPSAPPATTMAPHAALPALLPVAAPPSPVPFIPLPSAPVATSVHTVVTPPPIVAPPVSLHAPESTKSKSISADVIKGVTDKNPDIVITPLHLGDTSLMFNAADINVIKPFIEAYDNSAHTVKQETTADKGDDLTSLLTQLKSQENTTVVTPKALPNLYLGSIMYYSPSHWSVWINSKKVVNAYNSPHNQYYVSSISRTQVELVWKPPSLLDMIATWRNLTHNGAEPLPNIQIDETKGTLTLRLRPNQTFLPHTLTINEGLILTEDVPLTTAATASRPSTPTSATTPSAAIPPELAKTRSPVPISRP
jgi:hypothetical protein